MIQVNIHQAKTNLSKLVNNAANGEEFIIAKAGKPMVKVVPFVTGKKEIRRGGFLKNDSLIPDDFDNMYSQEIISMFEGDE